MIDSHSLEVKIVANLEQFKKAMNEATSEIRKQTSLIKSQSSEHSKAFSSIGQSASLATGGIKKLALALGITGTGLILAFRKAINTGLEFQEQMNFVSSVIRDDVSTSIDEVSVYTEKFSNALLGLAPKFAQTTDSLSKGLYQILSTGVKSTEALDYLEAAATAASGGFASVDNTVSALLTTMETYGKEVGTAQKATDLLANTVFYGRTTMQQLGEQIGRILPLGKQFGLPIQDLLGAFEQLTLSLGSTDRATTALGAVLQTLAIPTDEAKEAFALLSKAVTGTSYEFDAATIKTLGLSKVLEIMSHADEVLTTRIFRERRAILGILPLIEQRKNVMELSSKTLDANGKAQELLARRTESSEYKMKQAMESIHSSIVRAMQSVLPVVAETMVGMAKAIEDFTSKKDNVELIGKTFSDLVNILAKLRPVIGIFSIIADGLSSIFDVISDTSISDLKNMFSGVLDLNTSFSDFNNTVKESFSFTLPSLSSELKKSGIDVDAFTSKFDAIGDAFAKFKQEVSDTFKPSDDINNLLKERNESARSELANMWTLFSNDVKSRLGLLNKSGKISIKQVEESTNITKKKLDEINKLTGINADNLNDAVVILRNKSKVNSIINDQALTESDRITKVNSLLGTQLKLKEDVFNKIDTDILVSNMHLAEDAIVATTNAYGALGEASGRKLSLADLGIVENEAEAKKSKKVLEIRTKTHSELLALLGKEKDARLAELDLEYNKRKEVIGKTKELDEWYAESRSKIMRDIADQDADLIDSISFKWAGYYDWKKLRLAEERDTLLKSDADKEAVERDFSEKMKMLDNDLFEHKAKFHQLSNEEFLRGTVEVAKQTGERLSDVRQRYSGGVQQDLGNYYQGLVDASEAAIAETTDLYKKGTETFSSVWGSFIDGLEGVTSSFFKSIFTGDLDSALDAFNSFADSMAQRFIDALAEMAVALLTSSLASNMSSQGSSGGGSNFSGIVSAIASIGSLFAEKGGYVPVQAFANGGKVLGDSGPRDNVPAMLKGGEFVIRREAVRPDTIDQLNRINTTGSSQQTIVQNQPPTIVNFVDPNLMQNYLTKNPESVVNIISSDMSRAGRTRSTMRKTR